MPDLTARLQKKAFQLRKDVLRMCIKAGFGHLTSSLSCIDILTALYYGGFLKFDPKNPRWKKRDRFILSKGQASPALYAVLADLGYFDKKQLDFFAQKGAKFGVHLQYDVPGAEITSGSLGQGFGIAAGMALGAKMDKAGYRIFSLLGDGECYEGSIWETAMFAGHNKLNNLTAIIDRNYMCVTGFTERMLKLEPLEDKWRSFGWDACRIKGHNFQELISAFKNAVSAKNNKPVVIIAETVKGEGIKHISNSILWHGVAPKGNDAKICRKQLDRYCREA